MSDNKKLKRTPLYENHIAASAELAPFSGWEMPVQYSDIIKEHIHTRSSNSIFDLCHMGEFLIEGNTAEKDLENLLTCSIKALNPARCRYGFILNDDGCFIDDLIIFKYSSRRFMLVVNAARIEADSVWIREHLSAGTSFTDISDYTAKIDLQGPRSFETASLIFPGVDFIDMKRFSFIEFDYNGMVITAGTTGYTGEPGFEFFMPGELASPVWERLLEIKSVLPAGLGARDTLRLEKGLPLYGHDITEELTPIEANLERFVNFDKDFIGVEALHKKKTTKPKRILTPFLCGGKNTAGEGFQVFIDNKPSGIVTSGVYSPILKKGIGLAFLDKSISAVGSIIECRDADIKINAIVVDLPFVR